jgi:predicted phosphodiesterase
VRILLLSDLHIEFRPFEPPEVDVDVVVLAGDVHVGDAGLRWAWETFPRTPVVYVLGNHEYYGEAFNRLALELADRAQGTNVHVLERRGVEIDGVRFLGCTLWTDLALFGDDFDAPALVQECMNDYNMIRAGVDGQRPLCADDTLNAHNRSRRWLEGELRKQRAQKTVVVTHHAPSILSIGECERDDALACAYASALEDVVAASGAALWVHGHVHESVDYQVGGTRVVANARGYPEQYARSNASFEPACVLEV